MENQNIICFPSPLILLMRKNFSQQVIWLGLKRQRALEKLEFAIRYVLYPFPVFRECFLGLAVFCPGPQEAGHFRSYDTIHWVEQLARSTSEKNRTGGNSPRRSHESEGRIAITLVRIISLQNVAQIIIDSVENFFVFLSGSIWTA